MIEYEVVEKKHRQIRKTNKVVMFQGKNYIAAELAREQQLPRHLVYQYINEGLSGDEVVQKARLQMWRSNIKKLMK